MTNARMLHATRPVQVGGAAINIHEWGAGPSVLLLHGNPDSGLMWQGLAERLGTRRRCIAPDLPGFGRSQVPAGYERSLDGMAQFVEHFLGAAAVERPLDLIAHDFGGPFAFAWAIKHAPSVRRIVAINTLFFSDYQWHFWARVWRTPVLGELAMAVMNRPMFEREIRRGSGARIPPQYLTRTWALVTPAMKSEVLRLYRATVPTNFRVWENEFLALTAVKPTLVIWGDNDPYVPAHFAERFGAKRVLHLAQVGHWPPVEAPTECADAILQFFADNP